MSFKSEFKEFIAKGNVMDMAVGVIIGGAFKSIVDSLVGDVITPVIALVSKLIPGASDAMANMEKWIIPGTAINIGAFISAVINFLIMAFIIFWIVKGFNKLTKKKEEEAPKPAGPTQEELLTEIRDLLKK